MDNIKDPKQLSDDIYIHTKNDFRKKKIIIKNTKTSNKKENNNSNSEKEESDNSESKGKNFRKSLANFNGFKKTIFLKQNSYFDNKNKTRNISNKNKQAIKYSFIDNEKNKINNKDMNDNILQLEKEVLNLPKINTQTSNQFNLTVNNHPFFKKAVSLTSKNKTIKEKEKKSIKNKNLLQITNINSLSPEPELKNKLSINQTTNPEKLNTKSQRKKLYLKVKTYTKQNETIKEKIELKTSDKNLTYPKYPLVKTSRHSINKYIKSFAVNSYQGLKRNYNEDKVSIILTIKKPKNFLGENWPKISYLAIFDGHGGNSCSNFLRDNLHNYIIKNENFPLNIEKSLISSFEKAENDFINNIGIKENDKSGSCALVTLLIDNILYVANCGDSRAIISLNNGKKIKLLNNIHRPNNFNEKERIINNGGNIYISSNILRIFPGRLSVTRAFGDKNAKLTEFGGKKNVLISTPEVCQVNLKEFKVDFLIMGCDGIFEYLTNEDCVKLAWKNLNEDKLNYNNFHQFNGDIVDLIIKSALKRNSLDNVTALFVSFNNFEQKFFEGNLSKYNIKFFKENSDNNDNNENNDNNNFNIDDKKKPIIKFNSINNFNNNNYHNNKNNDTKKKIRIKNDFNSSLELKMKINVPVETN